MTKWTYCRTVGYLKKNTTNTKQCLNYLFVFTYCSWVLPVFFKGRKRELESSDMFSALNSHKSSTLGQSLSDAWERQLTNHKDTRKEPSLLRALWTVFGWRIAILGILRFSIELFLR